MRPETCDLKPSFNIRRIVQICTADIILLFILVLLCSDKVRNGKSWLRDMHSTILRLSAFPVPKFGQSSAKVRPKTCHIEELQPSGSTWST